MKKLSTLSIALLLSLGACMLNPLTPPPPAMDWSNPVNSGNRTDLVNEIKDLNIVMEDGTKFPIDVADDGTLKIPADALPEEFKDLLPTVNGEVVLDLHSIEIVNGEKRIVYKMGDSYVAAVYVGGKLVVKNSPTIDYGTIDWDSEGGIFEATNPTI